MFEYRGRKLDINQEWLDDFKKYNGFELSADIADDYIYNRYIKVRSRIHEIPSIVNSLTDEELAETINSAIRNLLCFYTCDINYGIDD